ncbi:unnamed protein product [Gadus morhua 'NCC']
MINTELGEVLQRQAGSGRDALTSPSTEDPMTTDKGSGNQNHMLQRGGGGGQSRPGTVQKKIKICLVNQEQTPEVSQRFDRSPAAQRLQGDANHSVIMNHTDKQTESPGPGASCGAPGCCSPAVI